MSLQQQRIAALCEELKLPVLSTEWSALAQRAADSQAIDVVIGMDFGELPLRVLVRS